MFHQERPGRHEKIFKLYKFRSMTDEKDADGNLLPDEVRLTRFGKLLRSTSLDELPELFNILKGDMSLIGPRPLLVRYLPYYTEEERHRHDVRPGLTGLAQVNGRNALGWEDRFRYDLDYVNHISLGLDLKIIGMTVGKVLKRSGTLSGAEQTVADFACTAKGNVRRTSNRSQQRLYRKVSIADLEVQSLLCRLFSRRRMLEMRHSPHGFHRGQHETDCIV